MDTKRAWEEESGVRVLRLYKTDVRPDWPEAVNKSDLCPDWPRVVILDLSAEQFSEFEKDPLAFAEKYNLYPEQKILWFGHCSKPPIGKGIPRATETSRWTLVINHCKTSVGTSAACPQCTTG
jgi:hypothetical protein